MRNNSAYMPKVIRPAQASAAENTGWRRKASGSSGPGVRPSTQTNSASATTATPAIVRITGELQPQREPSIAAKAKALRPRIASAWPGRSSLRPFGSALSCTP